MKVIVADEYGFCSGVERAIEIARSALEEYGSIEIIGELVHNREVGEELAEKGLIRRESEENVRGDKVIVRAHGMGRRTRECLMSRGVILFDATCQIVQKVYDEALLCEQKGCRPVLFGNREHPEILGVIDHLNEPPPVVPQGADFSRVQFPDRFTIIPQTTAPEEEFLRLVEYCRAAQMNFTIADTICPVVRRRMEEAMRLAQTCELIVVVGSRFSANTKALAAALKRFKPVIQVESAGELEKSDLGNAARIGLISGTSTPSWVVEEIFDDIEKKFVYKT